MRPAKSDTSRTAEIVCEALRDGTPLGETEQRRARMNFLRYNAGQGRVGSAAECGYVLQRDNDIFVVPTSGLFCIDEDDGVTGAVNVPDLSCYDCDRDLRIDLRDTLEKTLQGQDLANRRVFFVASNSSGPGEGCGRSAHQAAEMLRERGATVYATVRDAEGLI